MLTVGRDDDVRDGMEFIVYRGSQYIVKVRVVRRLDDMVACRVVGDTWNMEGVKIEQVTLPRTACCSEPRRSTIMEEKPKIYMVMVIVTFLLYAVATTSTDGVRPPHQRATV